MKAVRPIRFAAMTLLLTFAPQATWAWQGAGTEESPYLIADADDWNTLAYTAGKDNGKVVFYRIGTDSNVIPHGTAVIIVADELALTEGKVTLTKITTAGVTPGINILTGSDTDVTESGTVYVLGKDDGGVLGFYPLDGNTVPAGKAYYVE